MADLTLQDGTEITFDLSKLTWKEHLGLLDRDESDAVSYEKIARAAGMTPEHFDNLSVLDHKLVVRQYFVCVNTPIKEAPLNNPNSV